MMSSLSGAAILTAAGWVIGLAGLALALWAFFGDRARGRRRCPRCWYDMRGVDSLVCPECGTDARKARRLFATRRRWRWVAAALIVMLAGLATASVPTYRDHGWVGLVPSSIVVLASTGDPPTTPAWSPVSSAISQSFISIPIAPPAPLSTAEAFNEEAWRRLVAGRLARWQSQLFLDRYLEKHPTVRRWGLVTPARAGIGVPIPALWSPLWTQPLAGANFIPEFRVSGQRGPWSEGPPEFSIVQSQVEPYFTIDPAHAAGLVSIDFRLRRDGRTIYEHQSIDQVLLVAPAELLEHRDSEKLTDRARIGLGVQLAFDRQTPVVLMNDRADDPVWNQIDCGVAVRIELVVGDQVVGAARGWAEWARPVWKTWQELPIEWAPGGQALFAASQDRAQLRVIGDPEVAARQYKEWPFDKPNAACWTGQYTIPVRPKDQPE